MIKKGSLSLIICISFICVILNILFSLNFVSAVTGVNLKITGVVGDYSSDVWLRTDSNAGSGNSFDTYDMPVPSSPSDYSSFYSSITSSSLAIDSWNNTERSNIHLIYDVPAGQSGNLVFSWNDISSSADYTATFTITGFVTDLDMVSDSDNSYTYTASDGEDVSIYITFADIPTSSGTTSDDSGGGGGGGGSTVAVVQQPQINLIFNISSDKLLFDAGIIITDEFKEIYVGEKMRSSISLQPMGTDPDLDVYLKYYITDKNGNEVNVGDGESETIKVTGAKNIDKTFFTNILTPGEYTLHLELKYESEPGKFLVAEASSQFVVLKGTREEAGEIITSSLFSKYRISLLILSGAILVLIILIIIVLSLPVRRKKRHN